MEWNKLLTGRHSTDAYLPAIAVKNHGVFVTLDEGIPLSAVQGAQGEHLLVLNVSWQ